MGSRAGLIPRLGLTAAIWPEQLLPHGVVGLGMKRSWSRKMKATILAIATAAAITIAAPVALAQEAGFGNDPNASKNQVPAPSVNNPADPAAGNPGSAAQVPTAPQKQEDLYDSNAAAPSTTPSTEAMKKPQSSNPVP
jgi:hypothetical protein